MKRKTAAGLLLIVLLTANIMTAYALPEPDTAHYPRGGQLTLSPSKQTNNSYAFKPMGKAHNKVRISIDSAYAETCGNNLTIQLFIINEWGNWIQWGEPETINLGCIPLTTSFTYTIRERQPFCIVISAYGATGRCVIPYTVSTFS